jgi:hypothetical protein
MLYGQQKTVISFLLQKDRSQTKFEENLIRKAMSLLDEEPYLDSYCTGGEKETPQSCDLHGALHSSIREDDGPGYRCCRFLIEEKTDLKQFL